MLKENKNQTLVVVGIHINCTCQHTLYIKKLSAGWYNFVKNNSGLATFVQESEAKIFMQHFESTLGCWTALNKIQIQTTIHTRGKPESVDTIKLI